MIFGVDVDLTFFPSDLYWWDWMFLQIGVMPEKFPDDMKRTGRRLDYKLSNEVRDIGYPQIEKIDTLEFWRKKDLYDDMEPYPDVVEALKMLKDDGHEIVFVSTLKGDHHKSKYQALDKYCPFMDGFIGTKEKGYARTDIMIDDRISSLNLCTNTKKRFLFEANPYIQDIPTQNYEVLRNWKDFIFLYEKGVLI